MLLFNNEVETNDKAETHDEAETHETESRKSRILYEDSTNNVLYRTMVSPDVDAVVEALACAFHKGEPVLGPLAGKSTIKDWYI